MQVTRATKSEPVVVADPLFGTPRVATARATKPRLASARTAGRSITTAKDLRSVYFAPLANTGLEARSIKAMFPSATLLTGPHATKAALKVVNAPSILHIATHGFFLEDANRRNADAESRTQTADGRPQSDNPLLRAGLALSGANLGKDGGGEGILTALEASNLNLWGTKLVTLSACDTGIGEVRAGEGVYGLRRAFFLAGAETVVMSLWPVSDYVTREMMTAFYTGLKQGLGRGEALRQAQLATLKHKGREHPFYWASFIQAGDWTPLDTRR
jgi:CHAT domain-containing protein